jgi:8-oxo-dGTP pyrophosphatase MutT (NUDIX family)
MAAVAVGQEQYVSSCGMIMFCRPPASELSSELMVLMICRRNTIAFINYVHGRYDCQQHDSLRHLFSTMTQEELRIIASAKEKFSLIWHAFWLASFPNNTRTRYQRVHVYNRAARLHQRLYYGNGKKDDVLLSSLLAATKEQQHGTGYNEPEWEFPKGRSHEYERPYETALREFEEETGLSRNHVYLMCGNNLLERYTSYDEKEYRNYYFVGFYTGPVPVSQSTSSTCIDVVIDSKNTVLTSEVSRISFLSYSECLKHIRAYHVSKKDCLKQAWEIVSSVLPLYTILQTPIRLYDPSSTNTPTKQDMEQEDS